MPVIHPRAADLIATLALQPHPEGGFYREVFRSSSTVTPADGRGERSAQTSIYFLLPEGHFSRWHRVTSDEVWHLYEGGPLELLALSAPALDLRRHVLGQLGIDSVSPVCTIPAGNWQAARSLGAYTLVGCTVSPGFEFADFGLMADTASVAAQVRERWPDLAELL
jgi:predicted cupin superfamily sugar epimerase